MSDSSHPIFDSSNEVAAVKDAADVAFVTSQLLNQGDQAEGTNVAPPQQGEYRIPRPSGFKVLTIEQYTWGQAHVIFSWDDIDPAIATIAGYRLYAQFAMDNNDNPTLVGQSTKSPGHFCIPAEVQSAANTLDLTLKNTDPGSTTDTALIYTLGMKFSSDIDGYVKGIKFYKRAANTGTHVGYLYALDGTVLNQVTFTGETASGWQTMYFPAPTKITAATTYMLAYTVPTGDFSYQTEAAINTVPLHAPATHGYHYIGTPTQIPNTAAGVDYGLDVIFSQNAVTCWLQPFLSNGLTLPLSACPTTTFLLPKAKWNLNIGTVQVLIDSGVNLGGGGTTTGIQLTDSSTATQDTLSANLLLFFNGNAKSTATLGTTTPGTAGSQGVLRIFNGTGSGAITGGETVLIDGNNSSGNARIQLYGDMLLQNGTSGDDLIIMPGNTTTATAGAQTLPANPTGFIKCKVGGTDMRIPYYSV